jgi:aminoglycoside phosphotransferase (APT) family kinase protein
VSTSRSEAAASDTVPPRDPLDLDALGAWLAARGLVGTLEVAQFPGGFSNLTYLVRVGDAEVVLRRPPPGASARGGHDMARECRLLERLAPVYPKAPRPIACCDDASVLGAPFYVMERVRGVVLRGAPPPEQSPPPDVVRTLSGRLVDDLAALHAIDAFAAGLADLGRPDGYVERQVRGWAERWARASTGDAPAMDRVAAWLDANRPTESGASIVHNDFKYDNVVLDPADLTRVVAVLDWEMATLGDPLMDLGTSLAYWIDPDDPPDLLGASLRNPTSLPGNLSRAEVVARYEASSGRPVERPEFHYAFGLFKVGVIAQQIYARYARGLATDARFAALADAVLGVSRLAERAIALRRVDRLG